MSHDQLIILLVLAAGVVLGLLLSYFSKEPLTVVARIATVTSVVGLTWGLIALWVAHG